jgi:hypothetical protein
VSGTEGLEPADVLGEGRLAASVFERVRAILSGIGRVEVRTTKSQVAFRGRWAFAWLWRPGQHLAHPKAEIVLSISLGRCDSSPRWKEVVQPAPGHWMHHLEIRFLDDVDGEVEAWLAEAARRAGLGDAKESSEA